MSGERICFVVPRFHTNLFFATEALIKAGAEVHVIAEYSAPQQSSYSIITPYLLARRSKLDVLSHLKKIDPTLIISRRLEHRNDIRRVIHLYSFAKRKKTLIYSQSPVTRRRSLLRLFFLKLMALPIYRITPVGSFEPKIQAAPFSKYLPWPIAPVETCLERVSMPLKILCVGKLMIERKNHKLLIDAIDRLGNLAKHVKLTIVGTTLNHRGVSSDYFHSLKELSRNKHSQFEFSILENVEFSDMPHLYRDHDLCVLPAQREALGSAPIEAMAYGVIPIISTQCGSSTYIQDGVNGFTFNPDTPNQLQNILSNLVQDQNLVREIQRNVFSYATTELSAERFLQRFSEILKLL